MAKFSFGKRTPEDEGIPPEPVEGETEVRLLSDESSSASRLRRPLIFAGIGVVLIGGLYLANVLFFSEPPAPVPMKRTVPAPSASGQTPSPQPSTKTKDAAAGPVAPTPVQTPAKPEIKSEAKTVVPLPPLKAVEPPIKPSATEQPSIPPAVPEKSAAPAKVAPDVASPAKPLPGAEKAAIKAPPKSAAPSAKGFSVQVGAMAQQANAEKLKKRLDAIGFQAVVRKGSGFVNSHVVTVGDPTGKSEAEEMIRRLGVDGFPCTLASVEGKYSPRVGSFVNLDEAIDMARELQKKNYRPKITSRPATTALYQVRHGQFDTREAALKRGEELKAKGFNAWVVPN